MTKKRDLEKELAAAGFRPIKPGANHDKWERDGVVIAVPRHKELKNRLADVIRKEAGLK